MLNSQLRETNLIYIPHRQESLSQISSHEHNGRVRRGLEAALAMAKMVLEQGVKDT